MTVSKSWTEDIYDADRRESYRKSYDEAFGKGNKTKKKEPKPVKKTREEQIREDLSKAWMEHLNGRGEGNFLDIVVEYIVKHN